LKEEHGDVEVGAWHYAGGDDYLYYVSPRIDKETGFVVVEANGMTGMRR